MFATPKDAKMKTNAESMGNQGEHTVGVIKGAARHLKEDVQDAASAVREDLHDVARRSGQHVRAMADTAGHSLSDMCQTMVLRIRDKPVQSSVIALASGLVFGMLVRRR